MTKKDRRDKIDVLCRTVQNTLAEIKLECEILASSPDTDEAYKKGIDEAWEFARKITSNESHGGYSITEMCEIFGCLNISKIFEDNSYTKALAKLRDYEARKKTETEIIKVGDEVSDGKFVGVVTRIESTALHVVMSDGSSSAWGFDDGWRKTGRHFPEITATLKQLARGG